MKKKWSGNVGMVIKGWPHLGGNDGVRTMFMLIKKYGSSHLEC